MHSVADEPKASCEGGMQLWYDWPGHLDTYGPCYCAALMQGGSIYAHKITK